MGHGQKQILHCVQDDNIDWAAAAARVGWVSENTLDDVILNAVADIPSRNRYMRESSETRVPPTR